MKQFRLHVDVPVGTDVDEAIETANLVINEIININILNHRCQGMNYRLGHDDDEYKRNILNLKDDKMLRVSFVNI